MTQATIRDLKMNARAEVLSFLKRLWNGEEVPCPICGEPLEMLHKKAKRSNDDWQCRHCEKTYRTISLLMELNEKLPR